MLADRDISKVVLYTWDAPAGFLDDATAVHVDGVILKSDTGVRLVEALEVTNRTRAALEAERFGVAPPIARLQARTVRHSA